MKLLLDTHVFLWVRGAPERLRPATLASLNDAGNELFVSIVSIWEIAVKCRVGKLKADIEVLLAGLAPASKIKLLDLRPPHVTTLMGLPFHDRHRDPFDHLIIAQAISEGMTLVTHDANASLYPVRVVPP